MKHVEWIPEVTTDGCVIGKLSRAVAHSGSFVLHPVVHLHLFNSLGELYLQKRSLCKQIQPGKWDTAVGGHVDYGESIEQALARETREELGFDLLHYSLIDRYVFTSEVESELVYVFTTCYDGPLFPNQQELEDGRFWDLRTLEVAIQNGSFTPNFVQEFEREQAHFLGLKND